MTGVEPPELILNSASLLSKWGFNDGNIPDHLMDYWDDIGIAYPDVDWHHALCTLVHRFLLPELTKHHVIEVVDSVETIHNPIRAITIDGVAVEQFWYSDYKPTLIPQSVHVPYTAIAEICGLDA